ncbi:unnamed protein product [Lactuca saligna]|uniref:Uncharacterized protein n=1 Tax=Lactuca saligna TaxID=75948 RepID=A0AA35ZGH1_LACSI|nr:unnamed protein product [Lactuca saligna]
MVFKSVRLRPFLEVMEFLVSGDGEVGSMEDSEGIKGFLSSGFRLVFVQK